MVVFLKAEFLFLFFLFFFLNKQKIIFNNDFQTTPYIHSKFYVQLQVSASK